MFGILKRFLGDNNDKEVKRLRAKVDEINGFEEGLKISAIPPWHVVLTNSVTVWLRVRLWMIFCQKPLPLFERLPAVFWA